VLSTINATVQEEKETGKETVVNTTTLLEGCCGHIQNLSPANY
jgi:hypothetical protein